MIMNTEKYKPSRFGPKIIPMFSIDSVTKCEMDMCGY